VRILLEIELSEKTEKTNVKDKKIQTIRIDTEKMKQKQARKVP
jgi:hypothetical protein